MSLDSASDTTMPIADFLRQATQQLQNAGITTARLDCLVLLEDVTSRDRAQLLAHADDVLTAAQITKLNTYITQRLQHEPLAYIRGHAMFYGRTFAVDEHVLVPRPETEIMVELLKKYELPAKPRLADIGTGSGCIGITAALEIPNATTSLYDIDPAALKIAASNAATHHVTVHCQQSDLLQQVEPCDIVLANLPYVPEHFPINKAAGFEPKLALFAGADGLDDYKRFWQQAANLKPKPHYILTEAMPFQHHHLAQLARGAGYALVEKQDFIQVFEPI
jgi:release factor glutamine methyltransferase